MKKIIFGTLIALSMLQTVTLQAANLDADQWQNYCKENESRCETAIRLCEQNDQADCDEIRLAFMQEKPIPTSVIHSTSND